MRTIAIVNQKGGCGKTTTTVNLAGALAADGARVLVLDLDPQAHSTLALGVNPDELDENIFEILAEPGGPESLERIIVDVGGGVDLAPSSIVLSALEQKLASERHDARTERLTWAVEKLPPRYDYVLIDCPPNVGLLTFNALRAAQEVIIPLETSYFAIDGVHKLLETIGLLSDRIGHELHVRMLPTLYDGRTRYARQTLGDIRELFKDLCFDTVIRLNVKLREAARQGVPINRYAPAANGALDYASVAIEVEACPPSELLTNIPEKERYRADPSHEVVMRFRDANATDVRIAGEFNDWVPDKNVDSSSESEGQTCVWTKVLQLPPGSYEYRYVVDGEWREDPTNPDTTPSPSGQPNSVLVVQ
jgi:chromosome partitioning protein